MNQDQWLTIREMLETVYSIVVELRTLYLMIEGESNASQKGAIVSDHGTGSARPD